MSLPASTESQVLAGCLALLRHRGLFAWRSNQVPAPLPGGGFRRFAGLRGVSDILGVLPGGKALAVEVKKPGGRLRKEQRAFLRRVNELGGVGLVVTSVDELDRDLDAEGLR